jgi:hypothetical protein
MMKKYVLKIGRIPPFVALRNSYITSIPIDFVLPKLLNYLAFQSFDFELPDEGYSRNVHVHEGPRRVEFGLSSKHIFSGISLHLVEILGVLFLWCGFWCSRGCCLVIPR